MTSQARKVLEEALALSAEERVRLVEALQDSLEPVESQDEIDAAWRDEIVQRVQSIEDGTAELVDGNEVSRRIRARYER